MVYSPIKPLFAFAMGVFSICAALRAGPVDLTPRPDDFVLDGVNIHQFKFRRGSGEIEYRPPQSWNCTGQSDVVFVRPDKESSIRAEIRHREIPKFVPAFDEKGLEVLRAQAGALLPALPNLKLLTEEQNPRTTCGHETMKYTFSGVMFSKKYKFLVFLIPMENEEFSFTLYAVEKEFDEASGSFYRSTGAFMFE